ncbi:hypothetical protein GCM10027073_17690 [Streptomyces chlorus]
MGQFPGSNVIVYRPRPLVPPAAGAGAPSPAAYRSSQPPDPTAPPHGEHARHVKQQVNAIKLATAVGEPECNPSGQWAWLEPETGLPMAAAMADLLERKTA